MVTRGMRLLFTLPLLLALLVALCWQATNAGLAEVMMARPDQCVQSFLREVQIGNYTQAQRHLARNARSVDLRMLRLRLEQNYAPAVSTSARIRKWTPTQAVVWTQTRTTVGNRYTVAWELVREDGQWVIRDLHSLRMIVPDVPGM